MSIQRVHSVSIILILGLLNALTPFTIDLYLPAFPDIARDLNVEVQTVSLSVSVYFIGFAIGQLLYGPLLDRFGRKRPIYFGLAIYIISNLGCFKSWSLESLVVFRFLSALGGSAASVGATAMVRDYFPPKDAARVFAKLMLVLSVSPLFAPSLGGLIVGWVGWRALFAILTALAILDIGLIAWGLPEGYALPDKSVQLKLRSIFKEFYLIFRKQEFLIPTLVGSFSFAGLFVYVAGSPAIFMEGFGLTAQMFGLVFAVLVIGMIGGGQLNQLLIRRFSSLKILRMAITVQTAVAFIFLFLAVYQYLNLVTTIVCLFCLLSCAGIAYPNAAALALEPFSKNLGSASSLLGFLQLGTGAVVASGLGVFKTKGVVPTAAVIAIASFMGWSTFKINRIKNSGRFHSFSKTVKERIYPRS